MNEVLLILREFMVDKKLDYLLVNSTNKFLVEYNSLQENSRYHLTNFSGSTGDALVSMTDVFLFVDGRYHIQADLEVDKNLITVVKLQAGQSFLTEMLNKIPKDATLGLFSQKNSQNTVELIQKSVKVKLLDDDPLDIFQPDNFSELLPLNEKLTGLSVQQKIDKLNLADDEALFLTDLQDVSYMFNLRNYSVPFSSYIKAKAVITKSNAILFEQDKLDKLENYLKCLDKKIFIDKSSINAFDYNLIKDKAVNFNPVKSMRTIKTNEEIEHYKDAFARTDKTLLAVRQYIENNDNLSEFDIAQKLESEFIKNGAKSLSFNSIVAKDKNSALAHYSKSSPEEILTDGSLILIDCGAYFNGGLATDITRVFVKGTPSKLQKQVYTTVLKAFLNSYNSKMNEQTCGFDIDAKARQYLKENAPKDFVFNHGLGHGIGINVHECPPNLSVNEVAKTPIKENMCFTIEPGLYNANHFGVRLENSCYLKNNKINSFVKMPYEDKLIDYSMLNETEKSYLNEFGVI